MLFALVSVTVSQVNGQITAGRSDLAPAATQQGRLVIIGGGLSRDTESIYRAILDARRLDGAVCIVPTAGANPEASTASALAAFERWGGGGAALGIPISTQSPEAARDTAVVKLIETCSAFYFTGGVQSRIVQVFRPDGRRTPALNAILARYRAGAVVAGSSAGAAIMSDPMIAGGSTTLSLQHGVRRSSPDNEFAGGDEGLAVEPGIGFLRGAVVDQHFLARGRIGRLITAVLDLDEFDLGFGIDENTALVVDGFEAQASGESGVLVVDAGTAERDGRSATNVRLHLLAAGDHYDIESRHVSVLASRSALPVSADSVNAPEDVFARWQFLQLLYEFAQSRQAAVSVRVPGGELVLRKGPDFAARSSGGAGVQDTPSGLSITGLLVDVKRQEEQSRFSPAPRQRPR